jgi:hypothetical protein
LFCSFLSVPKDIRRIKDLRYERRLKGPVLVNAKQFTKAVAGTGIGITTEDSTLPLRGYRGTQRTSIF